MDSDRARLTTAGLSATRALVYALLLLGVFLTMLPFAWTALTSFKTFGEHVRREALPVAWSPRPYQGLPPGGDYDLALLSANWEGAPRSYSPLKQAILVIDGPGELSPLVANELAAESEKLLRQAQEAQARANALLAQAAELPGDQAQEIKRLQDEAARRTAQAAALESASRPYPLQVLFLAIDSSDDGQVNYDVFVLTLEARVGLESTVLKKGEWGAPYSGDYPDLERWGPHFCVNEASQDSLSVTKSWRVGRMLAFNYIEAWDEARFSLYLRNSLIITVASVLGALTFSVLAAYAFARIEFPGRDKIFALYLATLMIPEIVLLIPNFMLTRELNVVFEQWWGLQNFWFDNWPPLVVPLWASAASVFLLRQFFLQIPQELYEAALVDGCGHLRFLTRVVLPLFRAPLTSAAVLNAIASWNSFLWPLLVTSRPDWRPISVGLSSLIDQAGARATLLLAGVGLAIAPVLVLYLLAHKHLSTDFKIWDTAERRWTQINADER